MTTHKNINEEVIDNIIEYLQTIKHEQCDITIISPHIAELFGDEKKTCMVLFRWTFIYNLTSYIKEQEK